MSTKDLLTRFRKITSETAWIVTISGRYESYVTVGYHRPSEDIPAINVRLYPDSHVLAARISYDNENESFTRVEATYQYLEELLEDLPNQEEDAGE